MSGATAIRVILSGLTISAALANPAAPQQGVHGEWPHFGGDAANTKYSSLDQIDASNFSRLELAWRWTSISQAVAADKKRVRPGQFKPTPLMIDGRIFLPTELSQVAALDAGSGEELWTYDPAAYEAGRPANVGFQHRGVGYWRSGEAAVVDA